MSLRAWLVTFVSINVISLSLVLTVYKVWFSPKTVIQEVIVKTATNKPKVVHQHKMITQTSNCPFRSRPIKDDLKYKKKWRRLTAHNLEVYLKSAYLDERNLAGAYPWVRMPGFSIGLTEGIQVWCHLWVDRISIPMISRANIHRLHKIGAEIVGNLSSIVLSCQLRPYMPLPDHVSVTLTSSCEPYTNYIPLVTHDDPGSEACDVEFGICSSTQWIDFQDKGFIEWVEFYKLMGVTRVSLYTVDFKIDDPIIDKYKNESFLEVVELQLPENFTKELTFDISTLLKNFAVNDCLYKNLYRFCHVVMVNLEELVVPRNVFTNFSLLLEDLNKLYYIKPQEVSYKFYNHFFLVEDKSKTNASADRLKSTSNFLRTEPKHSEYGARSITRVTFCLAFFNHHCVSSLEDFHGELGVKVNPEIVSLHVYQSCDEFLHNEPCRYKNSYTVVDVTMLIYLDNLTAVAIQKL